MSQRNQNVELYEFGAFRVYLAERVLTKGQQVIPLTPKAFDTLAVLVRHRGHIVEKDELLKEVWPDTFVEEGVLAVNVAAIRKALSDGDEARSYIETVPRRGYRFVGEVRTLSKSSKSPDILQKSQQRKKSWLGLGALGVGLFALAAVGVAWYARSRSTSTAEASPPIPLTSYPGIELSPTFSPDGSQVAFSWNGAHQDNFDIYVKVIGGADAVRLTRDPARDMSPAWSPDGRHIAFARDGAVFLVEPTGTGERKLADIRAGDIEWTQDSKSLVISAGTFRKSQLLRLYVETTAVKELTTPPSSQEIAYGDFNAALSPDGLNLAFVRLHSSVASDLYVMPLSGGDPRRLTQNESLIRGIAWTADGREIVYTRPGLWRRSADARPGAPSKRLEGVDPTGAGGPAISRPSPGLPVRLAYEHIDLDINIWASDTQDSSVPARKLIASTQSDGNPQFSPDGRRIIFVSSRSSRSGNEQIWIANSDGSSPLQLTSSGSTATNSPRWSPDGKRIVFASMQNGNRDLYTILPDGSSLRRLTTEPSQEGRPSWSRDGRWIYCYSDRKGRNEIWKVPAEGGGQAVQVTFDGGHESFESPDGKLLYYEDYGIKGLRSISTGTSSGSREGTVVLSSLRPGYWAVGEKGIYFVDFDDRHAASHYRFYHFVVGASEVSQLIKFYNFKTQKFTLIGSIEKPVIRPEIVLDTFVAFAWIPAFVEIEIGGHLCWDKASPGTLRIRPFPRGSRRASFD
jgi:Tol biopolymer transport system component/DNA-binding winged helix-turn-helix (wHTH) protein